MDPFQAPTFEQWVENAFAGTPWKREVLFWEIDRPDAANRDADDHRTYTPLAPTLAMYLAQLFEEPEFLANRYTGEQLGKGFWYIAGIESAYFIDAREPNVPTEQQVRWVTAIGILYEKLFARVCTPTLSHRDEPGSHPLNSAVYMFWDMDTLSPYTKGHPHLIEPIFGVLERALTLDSIACQESALHGLGEFYDEFDDRVHRIVDAYLRNNPRLRDDLREYALNARDGYVL